MIGLKLSLGLDIRKEGTRNRDTTSWSSWARRVVPGSEVRQDILVPVHEGDRTGSGHLVFRRLDNGAQQFEGKLRVCQRAAHIGQVTDSLAGRGLKETGRMFFCLHRSQQLEQSFCLFLSGHPRIEAIEPQGRSGQVALFLKEEAKQGSAFLIFQLLGAGSGQM